VALTGALGCPFLSNGGDNSRHLSPDQGRLPTLPPGESNSLFVNLDKVANPFCDIITTSAEMRIGLREEELERPIRGAAPKNNEGEPLGSSLR